MATKKRHEAQKGQALVEFALTLPIFLLLVLGIIDLARVLFGLTQVIDGARQGVRYGLVQGLERDNIQWFDCAGMRQAVRAVPGLIPVADSDIDISWKDSAGNPLLVDCTSPLSIADFLPGDVLEVRVRGNVQPITPVLSSFVSNIPFSYTASRTIVFTGADYTNAWLKPPPRPQGFNAVVDCTITTGNNVDFTWTPMTPPDKLEIRSAYTGEVVATPDVTKAYCYDCDFLDPNGDMELYYLVAIVGSPPNQVESAPSPYSFQQCGTTSSVVTVGGSITGTFWHDVNNDGIRDPAIDVGIPNVAIYLESQGANGQWDGIGGDDLFYATSTLNDGTFEFHSLKPPKNFPAIGYRLVLVEESVNLNMSLMYDIDGDPNDSDDILDAKLSYTPALEVFLGEGDTWNVDFRYFSQDYYDWYMTPVTP